MRTHWLIGLLAVAGCAAPDGEMHADAGTRADGGVQTLDGADTGMAPGDLEALVTEAVAAYDRIARANCECLVENGGFKSVDDCLVTSRSGPTWIPCATSVLAANDSPEVRTLVRCLHDELDARAECLSTASCDSLATSPCENGVPQCVTNNSQLVVQLLMACPDLGLLSRL